MKKIAKLSLVAAIAVAGMTNVNAASLEEAFAASKVKGEIKSQYFQKENAAGQEASIWTNGGNLSLTTGSFNGLTAGVTFQTGHVAHLDTPVNNYNADMNASGSVMSEAYLAYTLANTTAKVGRQYITTPLVAGSGSRMFKQSFEGIVLVNTDVPNTVLVAGYVDKYQNRTDNAGGEPEFNQVSDGAYTVYAKNTSIANLAIQAQYAQIKALAGNDKKITYIDAAYKLDNVTIAGQTFMSDDGSATNSDGQQFGVKVTGNIAGVSMLAAYTTTDDEANVVSGLGSGADRSFAAAPIYGGGSAQRADTDSYKIALGYKVMGLGLNASYTNWDTAGRALGDESETNLTVGYAFNKALSTKVMYSKYDGNTDDNRSRVYLSYKF